MSGSDISKDVNKKIINVDSQTLKEFESEFSNLMEKLRNLESSSPVDISSFADESNTSPDVSETSEDVKNSELLSTIESLRQTLAVDKEKLRTVLADNESLHNQLVAQKSKSDDTIDKLKIGIEEFRLKYRELLDKQQETIDFKKKINSLQDDVLRMKEQISELKSIISEKDDSIETHKKSLSQRDEIISDLNSEVTLLKKEKDVIDLANRKMISQINSLTKSAKELESQLKLKDEEILNVRNLLSAEKDLADKKLKFRLKDFAEKEAKKDVLLNSRIKELTSVITKQRALLGDVSKVDEDIMGKFNALFDEIKQKRAELDYSIVDKEFDDLAVDAASLSKIIDDVGKAPKKDDDTSDNVRLENGQIDPNSSLVKLVRDSLKGGDPEDLIKRGLIKKGYLEEDVSDAISLISEELNLNI